MIQILPTMKFSKNLLGMLLLSGLMLMGNVSWGQTTVFDFAGGGSAPTGWTFLNNITSEPIDKTTYWMVQPGTSGDTITTATYNLSSYTDATFSVDITSFGSGTHRPLKVEVSYDGGVSYTQTASTAITTTSYVTRSVTLSGVSSQVRLRFSVGATSGRGIRLQNLELVAFGTAASTTSVQFASATSSLAESGLFVDVCASITNPSASTATTVNVTLNGSSTATNGADYDDGAGTPAAITFPSTLTFPANSSTDQCLTVYISNDDLLVEGNETIVLGLSSPSGGTSAALGSQTSHTVTITDNDAPANDVCATPVNLTVNAAATNGSMLGTTPTNGTLNKNDVWYTFTPSCSGSHTVTVTFASGPDLDVEIYPASSCPTGTGGRLVNSNSGVTTSETAAFGSAVGGTSYLIRVIDFNANASAFTIAVTTSVAPSFTLANTGTPSAGNIAAGASNAPIFGFRLTPAACTGTFNFTACSITTSGTVTTSDVSNFRLIVDADNDGVADVGEIAAPIATVASLANPLVFSSVSGQTGLSSAVRYLLIADVAGGAVGGRTITGSLANANVTANISVTGSANGNAQTVTAACAAPNAVTDITLTPTSSAVSGTITAPSGGATGYLVVRNATGTLAATPTLGTSYTVGSAFGTGTVVAFGTSTSFSDSPLSVTTQYHYFVFPYNNTSCSGGPAYAAGYTESTTTLFGPCLEEDFSAGTNPTSWVNSTTGITFSSNYADISSNTGHVTTSAIAFPSSMTFDLSRTGNATAKNLNIEVSTTSQTTGFTVVANYDHSNTTSAGTTACSVDLSAYSSSSVVYIKFNKTTGSTSPWRIDNIEVTCAASQPSIALSINATTGSEAATTAITLTATASTAVVGAHTVEVDLTGTGLTASDFSGVDFSNTVTISIANGATVGTRNFSVADDATAEGTETATFTISNPTTGVIIGTPASVNFAITDNDNVTSTESVIVTQGGEATSISSLINGTVTSSSDGVQVWHFRLYDGNGSGNDADTKPTIYEGWTIRPGAGNTVPDWSAAIASRKFFQGASATPIGGGGLVNATDIPFPIATPITVADNGFVDIYMRITLADPLPAGSDGEHFRFSLVPADVTIESDVLLSSQPGTYTATSNATLNEIDIDATLQFISAPTTVGLGDAFTITVSAIDANGNIDQDDNTLITLAQNTGTGNLTGENAANLVNGTYTWTGLTYDTEEVFQVLASGGSYTSITANINVVDAPYQSFDHFNRPDSYTVGNPSSETTAWSEAGTGNGSRTRVEGGQLVLTNCNDGESSNGSNGMEQVMFNVETRYETVFDNAGQTLEWVFNMHQDRNDPSGFGSNTYGVGMILGADQANVNTAGADGYAVIIGNASSGDPKPLKLVRFTNGLTANTPNVVDIAVTSQTDFDNYYSVRVTFDPCSGLWSIYARNDGTSAFADPTTGSLGTAVTGTDVIHTALDLKYYGAVWQHGVSCTETARFDNLNIPNSASASTTAKVWNGSVNANWNEPNNWEPCPGVPTNTDDVIIANVATQPIVSVTPAATCKNLTVNTGADLTINSGQFLNVYGNVVNNGTANFGAGTLVMEGGATATLAGNVNVANFHASSPVTLNGVVTVSAIARSETGGAITANGNLVIESGAQLLHGAGTTNGGGSVSGNIVVRRQGTASTSVYNYWSTPVVGGTLPGSSGYLYNSALGTHDYSDDTNPSDPGWQSFGGAMTNGRGYASTAGGLASFTGAANNANITYGVTTTANGMSSLSPGTRFNLVGNPYPSAISANTFISVNGPSGTGRIAGVIYFWDDDNSGGSGYTTSDYAVWSGVGSVGGGGHTPNGSIATGQGFHVDAQSNGTVSFTNAMRGGNNSQFFRLAEPEDMDRIWLNISGNDLFNQTLVVFKDDATELRDVMYDAHKVRGNANIALGAMQANEPYAIAVYPTITQPRIVPLQTFVAQSGTYTFEADSIDGFEDIDVYLEDLQTGHMYLLSQGTTVTVQMTAQDEFNRFQLWLSPELVTGIDEEEERVSRIISTVNGMQVQMGLDISTAGEFKLYNAMGQVVMVQPLSVSNGRSGMVDVSALPIGVYHAEFLSAEGTITAKTIK